MAKNKNKAAHGGRRSGSGRRKGTLNATTLDKMKVNEHVRQRTMRVADILFEHQLSLARGQMFLFRIDKAWISTKGGKSGFWKNKKPLLVTNQTEITSYLEGEYDDRDEDNGGASYYYVTTKEPNGQTIESMLDRALGGATKALEVTNPDGNLKQIIIIKHGTKRND